MKPSQAFVLFTLLACSQATSVVNLNSSCKKLVYLLNNFMQGMYTSEFPENAYYGYSKGSLDIVFPVEVLPEHCYAQVNGTQANITVAFVFQAEFSFPNDGFNLTASSSEVIINFTLRQKDSKMLPIQIETAEITNIGEVVKHTFNTNKDVTNEMKDILKYILTVSAMHDVAMINNLLTLMGSDNISDTVLFENATITYALRLLLGIAARTGVL